MKKNFLKILTRLFALTGIILLVAGMILGAVVLPVSAGSEEWDKSSLLFDDGYSCQGSCTEVRARVCNGGSDMLGPSSFEVYFSTTANPKPAPLGSGTKVGGGDIPALTSGACTVLDFQVQNISGNYTFRALQRPGHPGQGDLWSGQCTLQCTVLPLNTEVAPTNTPIIPTKTVVSPTNTPVNPTKTPIIPTSLPVYSTNTPVNPTYTPIVPTNTLVSPTITPIGPTNTPVSPTNTPAPTNIPINPSNTPVVPTNTLVTPENTTVAPTNTPLSPSNTPVSPTATSASVDPRPTSLPTTTLPTLLVPENTPVSPTYTPINSQPSATPEKSVVPTRSLVLATLPPPAVMTAQPLIPQTGSDLGLKLELDVIGEYLLNIGMIALGCALALHGLSLKAGDE